MEATKNMADAELRKELKKLGFSAGPITDSTRELYKKKLQTLKANSAKSQKTRKSEGNTRSRRSEPLEDDIEDSEDEDDWASVSARPGNTSERNSYGGSGRYERADYDSRTTTSHVGDTGPGRSDRSSLGGLLSRTTANDHSYKYRSSLGGDRPPRTTSDYSGNSVAEARFSLGGHARTTSDYGSYLGQDNRYLKTTSDYGSLGQESRSLLEERYTRDPADYGGSLGRESRISLGGDRYTRNTSDYGGYPGQESRSSLGGEKFPKTTFSFNPLGQEVRSPLGGERSTRNTTASYLGQDLRWRSAADRDEGRLRSSYKEWGAKDQLSYINRAKTAQSKPNWSKTLEYYLSKLVVSLSVGLLIVFFAILIMKSGIFYSTQLDDIKRIPPDCEGKDDKYCKVMQRQITLQILSELYNFLSSEAGSFECGNPSGLSSKCIPIKKAKEHVLNVYDHTPEKFDSALDWLLDRDEHLGIWPKDENGEIVTTSSHVYCVESSQPLLGMTCRLTNALYTAISSLFLALFGVFVLWLFLIYLRYHWRKLEEEEKQMFALVEKSIDAVKYQYQEYSKGNEQVPFIGILHIRDTLIVPQDRKRLKKVWDQAVQFVENQESRIRTESQQVAGANLRVWRWTHARTQ